VRACTSECPTARSTPSVTISAPKRLVSAFTERRLRLPERRRASSRPRAVRAG
jgi:hypothetical protein